MITAFEAFTRLKEGNERFAAHVAGDNIPLRQTKPTELTKIQQPMAIILGCSDARVPAEMVFDQGLGDLFVIRVAGNIVAPSQVGSVEFAASRFGTRLVVVLGHSECGAILATLETLQNPGANRSRNLASIVDRVRRIASRQRCSRRSAGEKSGAGEHSCISESLEARVADSGTAHSERRFAGCWCRVFTGDWSGRFL